jgi:protein-S-isoprenylcysteine O-methyltransferase Ste14
MALREELEKQGAWLFRWRSYLPLIILPLLFVALRNSEYLERTAGDAAETFWEVLCAAISLLGLTIRCITVGYVPEGTSGTNKRAQKAEILNTTGMYSVVRHPLYLGNFIIILGITLFVQVWWLILVAVLAFWLYYERIMFTEEEYLRRKFGNSYLKWARRTPSFLPKFKNWQKPCLAFSFRTVLRRESSGFFGIITSFIFLEVMGDILTEGKLELDLLWAILLIISIVTYLTLRILKKKTRLLNVEGR